MQCGARRCNGQKLQVGELVRRDVDTRRLHSKLGLRRMHNDLWIDLRVIPASRRSVFRDAESSQRNGETERRRVRFDEIHPGLCRGRRRLKQLKRIRWGWCCRLADRRSCYTEKKSERCTFHSTPLRRPKRQQYEIIRRRLSTVRCTDRDYCFDVSRGHFVMPTRHANTLSGTKVRETRPARVASPIRPPKEHDP